MDGRLERICRYSPRSEPNTLQNGNTHTDFPATQRFQVSATDGANGNYWNYSPLYFYSYGAGGKGIGFNNGNAKRNFKLKKFVASKLPIAE